MSNVTSASNLEINRVHPLIMDNFDQNTLNRLLSQKFRL